MNIKQAVYESLTPEQRVIATYEALARNDDDEVVRLKKTCPRKTFTFSQNDPAYAHTMGRLFEVSTAVEFDLLTCAMWYTFGQAHSPESHDFDHWLQHMTNIKEAGKNIFEGRGIRATAVGNAPRHGCVSALLDKAFFDGIWPQPDKVEEYAEDLHKLMAMED